MPVRAAVPTVAFTVNQVKEDPMVLYAILRRGGWKSGAELQAAAARSTR